MTAAILIAAALTAAFAILRRRYLLVTVAGISMRPAFDDGDRILVRRTGRAGVTGGVAAGRVVVLQRPGYRPGTGYTWDLPPTTTAGSAWLVKRVVALPGHPVPDGIAGTRPGEAVPPGHVIVLGDNEDASLDSRRIGPVPLARILGVVTAS